MKVASAPRVSVSVVSDTSRAKATVALQKECSQPLLCTSSMVSGKMANKIKWFSLSFSRGNELGSAGKVGEMAGSYDSVGLGCD
jgi:hypothetical protein